MKIREAFVSNSSSCSFIVFSDFYPKNINQLKTMLGIKPKEKVDEKQINRIFNDLKQSQLWEIPDNELIEIVSDSYYEKENEEFCGPIKKCCDKKLSELLKEEERENSNKSKRYRALVYANAFFDVMTFCESFNKGIVIYKFIYDGDGNGPDTKEENELYHGEIFKKSKHFRIQQ